MLTHNSERRLRQVLEAIQQLNQVCIYDSGSTDGTLEIASSFSNVTLERGPFLGFGALRNGLADRARNDWILALDSDEVVSPELVEQLASMPLQEECLYSFPFRNYFQGRWIRGCGWWPDRHVRLYNRRRARFSERLVHERIEGEGLRTVQLDCPIDHYSYETVHDFTAKMHRYSDLFAREYCGKRRATVGNAVGHGIYTFIKSYLLRRGCLEGSAGFLISSYQAQTAFYKYMKLRELNAAHSSLPSAG
jgi:glycosyltransferase involved in cell wall biosynthesis